MPFLPSHGANDSFHAPEILFLFGKVGLFERKIRLGSLANRAQVDVDAISAKLEDGILRVEVPKQDKDYVEVKSLLFDHAFATFETVELRVGVDNTRTRHAIEDFLGAVYTETVSTPLGDHAVYLLSRDAWAERA